jgi:hypothetical protein
MAFLDNSGDIILDAVLTDTGRLRLAQGDGSFKISKFALGDDEINYALYDKNHASGSAYYDLQVLQTPVLESFTNNTSNMKTKLVSISRTNVLFMPILKLNKNAQDNNPLQFGHSKMFQRDVRAPAQGDSIAAQNKFYVAVDKDTWLAVERYRAGAGTAHLSSDELKAYGWLQGYQPSGSDQDGPETSSDCIRIDQGLDTTEIPPSLTLDTDLLESAYITELDYRLGRIKNPNDPGTAAVNFIDDDNIASYYLTNGTFVNPINGLSPGGAHTGDPADWTKTSLDAADNFMVFEGPRGSTVQFRIEASQELQQSTYLFTQIGSSQDANATDNILGLPTGTNDALYKDKTIYYIDSTIRVVGANTGFRLDVPVRYVKVA